MRNEKRERTPSPAASSDYRRPRRQEHSQAGIRPWRGGGTAARTRESSPAASSDGERDDLEMPKASPKRERPYRAMRDAPRGARTVTRETSRERKRFGERQMSPLPSPQSTPPRKPQEKAKPRKPKKSPANSDSESDLLATVSRRPGASPEATTFSEEQPRPEPRASSPLRVPEFKSYGPRDTSSSPPKAILAAKKGDWGKEPPTRISALPLTPSVVARPTRFQTAMTTAPIASNVANNSPSRSPTRNISGECIRPCISTTRLVTASRRPVQDASGSTSSSRMDKELMRTSSPARGIGLGSGSALPGPPEYPEGPPRSNAAQRMAVTAVAGYSQQAVVAGKSQGQVTRTYPVSMKRMLSSPGPLGLSASASATALGATGAGSTRAPRASTGPALSPPPASASVGGNTAAVPRGVFYTRT